MISTDCMQAMDSLHEAVAELLERLSENLGEPSGIRTLDPLIKSNPQGTTTEVDDELNLEDFES